MATETAKPARKKSRLDAMQQLYPYTRMNFLVTIDGAASTSRAMAAFTEVSGINASVDVIEFRQGNSGTLAKAKIPGLVKYSNVTFRFGYTVGTDFIDWTHECLDPRGRSAMNRHDVYIEILNPQKTAIDQTITSHTPTTSGSQIWILRNAFVASYKGADLDAKTSEIAIESLEIAFEEITFPDNGDDVDQEDTAETEETTPTGGQGTGEGGGEAAS